MKRKFRFKIMIYKDGKPYMEYVFNTVKRMYFSQAYNLLYGKLRNAFSPCLGYEFTVTEVTSNSDVDFGNLVEFD